MSDPYRLSPEVLANLRAIRAGKPWPCPEIAVPLYAVNPPNDLVPNSTWRLTPDGMAVLDIADERDAYRNRYGLGSDTLARILSWRKQGLSWATIASRIAWHPPTLFQHYQWAAKAAGYTAEAGCPDLDPSWPDSTGQPRGPVLCESYPRCLCGDGTHRHSADGDGRKVGQQKPAER